MGIACPCKLGKKEKEQWNLILLQKGHICPFLFDKFHCSFSFLPNLQGHAINGQVNLCIKCRDKNLLRKMITCLNEYIGYRVTSSYFMDIDIGWSFVLNKHRGSSASSGLRIIVPLRLL